MINILMLYKKFGVGGAEKVIIDLCENLDKSKYKITIASKFEMNIQLNGVNSINIDFNSFNPFEIGKHVIELINICRHEKINLIHSHHRYTTAIALLVGKILNIEVIHTEHNVFPDKNIFNFRGKHIIAVSNKVRKELINLKIKDPKLIYNGVKITSNVNNLNTLSEKLFIKDNAIHFGVIARLSHEKGIFFLLEAMCRIVEIYEDIQLIIIGDGDLKQQINEYIAKNNLESNVILLGQRKDVMELIPQLDFFILPSLYEGLPLTILEVMSKGKVMIATDVGGNSEIITDGVNGILIQSNSVDSIVNAIMKVANMDSQKLKQMEENARKTIVRKFSLDRMIAEHESYYNSVLFDKQCSN